MSREGESPPLPAEEAVGEAVAPVAAPLKHELVVQWERKDMSFEERDALLDQLRERGLFPKLWEETGVLESEAGLYPSISDPKFSEKLMSRQEFAECRQDSIKSQLESGADPCDPEKEFELTPVQRFVGRFLSPQCPYQSALLYHGVGVGKTCAAITIAENYLAMYPRRQVYIIAPRNIQSGFKRTIFDDDEERLKIPEDPDLPNTAIGCTGNTYLHRTGTLFEKNRATIARRVAESVKSRYVILGYIQFARLLEGILSRVPKGLPEEERRRREIEELRQKFSGRLVIIDEAHNVRAMAGDAEEDAVDAPGGDADLEEGKAGSRLAPGLLKLVRAAQGMKLVLMTGTPMYNSYKEIIFLLSLLLLNDKRVPISEKDIFQPNGEFRPAEDVEIDDRESGRKLRGGREILGAVAGAYVSFMRGENPLSFPVRLPPVYKEDPEGADGKSDLDALKKWPGFAPGAAEISEDDKRRLIDSGRGRSFLPFVPVSFPGPSLETYKRFNEQVIAGGGGGIDINTIDKLIQAGNWMFPNEAGAAVGIGDEGFKSCFMPSEGAPVQYSYRRPGGATWMKTENLAAYSPKGALILRRAARARGPVFVYSRFVGTGALPLALALEANGYTAWNRDKPLLAGGAVDPALGRQCALCERRERQHAGAKHGPFVPAKYVLITGDGSISPNNPAAIAASRAKSNMIGKDIKVIIGSKVASEGVDFRFIREIYVFDAWYHLNKLEQVLGRGIRTCSHAILGDEGGFKRKNCTIYLLVNTFGPEEDSETADLMMYRIGMNKAVQFGQVTRVMKEYAVDCNVNRPAILITGLKTQNHVDGQGIQRPGVSIDDTPFTFLSDWLEDPNYECKTAVNWDTLRIDTSSYDEYAVRWQEMRIKRALRNYFEEAGTNRVSVSLEKIRSIFQGVPAHALSAMLAEIVSNQAFRLRVGGQEGYLIYRNGRYLFQPLKLRDTRIPLALRIAAAPVKRDLYEPPPPAKPKPAVPIAIPIAVPMAAAKPAEAAKEEENIAANAPAAAAGEGGPPAAEALPATVPYWNAIKAWAATIAAGTSPMDLPPEVQAAIAARYNENKDEKQREIDRLIMISWMVESMRESPPVYKETLAKVLLEFIWDESLTRQEQQALLSSKGGEEMETGREQYVSKGGTDAFRYVNPSTGLMQYMCADGPCYEAVARVFDADKADSLNQLKADRTTTGDIYGFLVPKMKDARLIFKTSDAPVAPGAKPEKGSECSIISTILPHIKMLKEIGAIFEGLGYPRFLMVDEVLDEKERRRVAREEAKAAGRALPPAPAKGSPRTFENVNRACALKDIALRWLDKVEQLPKGAAAGQTAPKRYFYRSVAAYKSGHRVAAKGGK
jgi:hypothetical protein